MRRVTVYPWHTGKLRKPVRLLVVCDLHNAPYGDLMPMLTGMDALLVPGDVSDRYHQQYDRGLAFLREAAEIVPTFVSLGNHEWRLRKLSEYQCAVAGTRAQLLVNRYIRFGELSIGGWYRPELLGQRDMLPRLETAPGVKILLSHHPEDYPRYLHSAKVDLILAGHAHGGQIRLGRQGLYAPGQGLFPSMTRGVVDHRMIVSAGASNTVPVPRIGNPCEVLRIDLD